MGSAVQRITYEGKKYKNLTPTMKAFVAVALAAAAQAAPEADPQVLLAQPLVYGNAHTQIHSEVKHANGAVVPDDTLSVKVAKAQHLTAKANAYLNKPLVYTAPVVKTVATAPVVQQTLPLVHQTVASPIVSYTGAYPYHFIKREADSEAQPEAEADPAVLINGAYPSVYGAGLYGHQLVNPAVTYTTPLVSNVATVAAKPIVPTVVKTPVVSYNYGLHTPLTTGYTGYAHLIKREADYEDFQAVDLESVSEPRLIKREAYDDEAYLLAKPARLIKREAEADPLTVVSPYTGLYGNVYGAGVYGAHHLVNPVTYTVPAVKTVTKAVVPTVAAKTVVAAPSIFNYGIHTPLTTGYTHLIKREAQAEADPALLINGSYPSVYGAGLYGHQLVNPAMTYPPPLVPNVNGYTGYTGLYY